MVAAALPLWLSVLGIVLRGAGFAFRKEVEKLRWKRLLGATFALSSLLTPFFIGTVVGAVVAGKIALNAEHSTLTAWTNPTSILTGCLFVIVCAYEAAVFLLGEATTRRDPRLARYFRRRAAIAGAAAGALSLADLLVLRSSDAALADRLTGRALPLVVVAGVCGIVVFAVLVTGRTRGLRVLSASGVAAVVWAWGVAQYPTLLPETGLTLSGSSAPHATLVAVIAVAVLAVALVVPGFFLLFFLHGRQLLESDAASTEPL
jgi:cytochrome d ubiquinol oxidase subunit II